MSHTYIKGAASLLIGLTITTTSFAATVAGTWLTESKKAHVQIQPCGEQMCGNIVWLKEPNDDAGMAKTDKENPDEAMKKMPLLGSKMISEMKIERAGRWIDGKIYDAESGKTYASVMELSNDNTLAVSGCVFIFCKEQVWERMGE